jgi:hypothetical protein
MSLYEDLVPKDVDPVPVHEYSHPDWDMKLIVLAEPDSRRQALDLLGEPYTCSGGKGGFCWHDQPTLHNNPAELRMKEGKMPRKKFVNLPEFDG